MSGRSSVLVVGGGLAGITAACDLADRGFRVKLVEKRPFLGGRAYSYRDGRSGLEVDNGQHVFLGCCTDYIALLKRLGVWHRVRLQKRLRVRVIDKLWGESVLESASLPAPLHLLPSLLRFRSLSAAEKVRAAYALSRMRSLKRSERRELDDITFAAWLRRHGQSERAIRGFWNLIVLPTLNGDVTQVTADLALMVFQEGFLRDRNGANVGWSKVGLTSLLGEAASAYIRSRGGEVYVGEGAEGVRLDDGRAVAPNHDADFAVLAVEPKALPALLPRALSDDPFFARVGRIKASPIVNVHLWYDRHVTDIGFAAFLNTPLQWLFNKSRLWKGSGGEGPQYLDVSLSGADDFIDVPGGDLVEIFDREVRSLLPLARTARLDRALVGKQRDATFAAHPGIARLRPSQRTPVPNLFLAGDWTDTRWPATMESAVRSGIMAARDVEAAARGEATRREVVAAG